MIKPEQAALQVSLRPTFRPTGLRIAYSHPAIVLLLALSAVGIAAYVFRLTSWGESERAFWAYPTVILMFILSTAA